tara:strand:+ start:40 stop:411 length:372 start_codon:yes stop_codon:yes gene_type:complete
MNFVSMKDKLADIEIAIREFGLALRQCINDFRISSRIGVKYPVSIKYENKCAHIIENKYKSFLVTLDDSGYNDMVRIQLCRRDGKIVDGMMIPEPIEGSYVEIDARKMYSFIEVFRKIGNNMK